MKPFSTLIACALALAPLSASHADEADIKAAFATFVGHETQLQITKTPYGGLYEVLLDNGEMAYTDEKGTFILTGELLDLKRKTNVTQERLASFDKIDFSTLPLGNAIKQVRGNGKRVVVSFEDPNCGYCKRLAASMKDMKDVTVYTFLYPILSPDSTEKSKTIWCSKDRAKAWQDWMLAGKLGEASDCKNPVEQNTQLGRKMRISGTPTMFLADGTRIKGMPTMENLEKALAMVESAKPATKK